MPQHPPVASQDRRGHGSAPVERSIRDGETEHQSARRQAPAPGRFDLDRDMRSLLDAPGEDIVMVKVSQYFSL